MGRSEEKSKKRANDSLVTWNLSQMLENVSTPGSTARTPKPPFTKTLKHNLELTKDYHPNEKPHCQTADKIAFICTSLIAENLGYDIDLTAKLKQQFEAYFKAVCIVSDDTLNIFDGQVWPKLNNTIKDN